MALHLCILILSLIHLVKNEIIENVTQIFKNSLGSKAYDVFPRKPPSGTHDISIYHEQFYHRFSAAYICDQKDINDLTCLNVIPEFMVELHNANADWSCIVEFYNGTRQYRLHDRIALETSIWAMKPEWGIDLNCPLVHTKYVAMTISRWSFSYYHFVTEALWRILRVLPILERDYQVWINMSRKSIEDVDLYSSYEGLRIMAYNVSFIRSYLDLVGVKPEQVIMSDGQPVFDGRCNGPIVVSERMIYPSASFMVAPSRERLNFIRQSMYSIVDRIRIDQEDQRRDLLIYFSRNGEWSRNLSLSKELEILYNLIHFYPKLQIIIAGRMDKSNDYYSLNKATYQNHVLFQDVTHITNMINLVRRSKVIIGVHGAGLSNILWARPDTIVIELLPITSGTLIYWHMSEALGLQYWFVPIRESSWHTEELSLDIILLNQVLEKILDSRSELGEKEILNDHGTSHHDKYHNNMNNNNNKTMCPPGTFRKDGYICVLCPTGTYNSLYGQNVCLNCPHSSKTMFDEFPMEFYGPNQMPDLRYKYGSDSIDDCSFNDTEFRKRNIDDHTPYGYSYYSQYSYYGNDSTTNISATGDLGSENVDVRSEEMFGSDDKWWIYLIIAFLSISIICLILSLISKNRNNIN
jgi:hypothetical protein